jgi:hypothetical protein
LLGMNGRKVIVVEMKCYFFLWKHLRWRKCYFFLQYLYIRVMMMTIQIYTDWDVTFFLTQLLLFIVLFFWILFFTQTMHAEDSINT